MLILNAEVLNNVSFHYSYVILASITVPYLPSMLLGRTFDYSKSKVGNDIYDENARNNAEVTKHFQSYTKFKIIKSNRDVNDALEVSGQLSLKVMAGMVDVEGKGSYLKSSIKSGNTVEVLARLHYRTVRRTYEL